MQFNPNTLTGTDFAEASGCGGSGLAMDNNLNLLYDCSLISSPRYPLNAFLNTGTIASPVYTSGSSQTFGNTVATSTVATAPIQMHSDPSGNIWTPNLIATSCSVNKLVPIDGSSNPVNPVFVAPASYTLNTIAPVTAGGSQPLDLEIDHNGTVWFACTTGFNHIAYGTAAGNNGVNVSGVNQLNGAKHMAIDGAGDIWVVNGTANPVTGIYAGNYFTLSEFNNSGTAITPNFASTGAVPPGGFPIFSAASVAYPGMTVGQARYMVLDGSGNAWATNYNTTSTGNTGNIVQLVGVAVPVFTPLGAAASQNRLGTLP